MIRRKKTRTTAPAVPVGEDAVARLQEQVRTAKGMAAVPGRELLEDAATNPAVHSHAARLRDRAHRRQLDMAHARTLRSLRVRDARADRAERALEAVAAAREADSPALAVLELTRWRPRMAAGAIGASLLLSVGSAMGIEALAASWSAPTGVGYIAEAGLTGLSTAAIVLRGWQVRHGATLTTGQTRAMTALMFVPLLGSIVASTAGSGPVGAACSIGAAAFAALAYLVATTLSTAIRHQVERLDGQADEAELATVATGQESAGTTASEPERLAEEGQSAHTVADEAAAWLRATPLAAPESEDDESAPERSAVVPPGEDGATSTESFPQEGEDDGPPAALEDAARRRAEEAAEAVARYYQDNPGAPVKRAARELGVDPKTVRKYRPGGER